MQIVTELSDPASQIRTTRRVIHS